MSNDEKFDFYEKIKNYYSIEKNENYKKMIIYYEKYLLNNNYINFQDLKNEDLINRTNNYIENFPRSLNCELDVFHPKLSYPSEKFKNYITKDF